MTRQGLAALPEHGLRVELGEQLDEARYHAGPTGLVGRAEAGAVVTVKVLMEQQEVAPVLVLLELLAAAVHRSVSVLIPLEDADKAVGELLGHPKQRHDVT